MVRQKKVWDNDESHTITITKDIPEKSAWDETVEKTRKYINEYGEEDIETYHDTVHHDAEPARTEKYTSKIAFPETPPVKPTEPQKPVDPTGIVIYDYTDVYAPDDFEIIGRAKKLVTGIRAHLGAQENRLEHTYRNNQNKAENTQAAESLIRDTDMAEEMVRFSKHNILTQVGESMMAQANQSNQGVMTLLG